MWSVTFMVLKNCRQGTEKLWYSNTPLPINTTDKLKFKCFSSRFDRNRKLVKILLKNYFAKNALIIIQTSKIVQNETKKPVLRKNSFYLRKTRR